MSGGKNKLRQTVKKVKVRKSTSKDKGVKNSKESSDCDTDDTEEGYYTPKVDEFQDSFDETVFIYQLATLLK